MARQADASNRRVESFDALYESHYKALHAYFLARCSDREIALDLLQEAMARAWRHIDLLTTWEVERRRAWLFTVAKRLVVDHYRCRRAVWWDPPMQDALEASRVDDPAVRLIAKESFGRLEGALATLDETSRTALLLHVMGEMTSAQIGAVLGRPPGTVRYLISRARAHLARAIEHPSGGTSHE